MRKSIESVFLAFVFLMVLLSGCAPASTPIPPTFTLVPTNTPIPPTAAPTYTPPPTPTQVTGVIESIAPVSGKNLTSGWASLTLTRNLNFSSALEMKLNMESTGRSILVLTSIEGGEGEENWWKGTKRMEIECAEGILGVILRHGTGPSERMGVAFDNIDNDFHIRPAMPTSNGVTTCQITVKFDQYAKNIQIFQDDKTIFKIAPEQVGDFQGGLFPDGKILRVDMTSAPKSGDKISTFKLIELVFSIP